jgi:hypothetical protein
MGSFPGYLEPVQVFRPAGQPNAADFSAAAQHTGQQNAAQHSMTQWLVVNMRLTALTVTQLHTHGLLLWAGFYVSAISSQSIDSRVSLTESPELLQPPWNV